MADASAPQRCLVYCRLRPNNNRETAVEAPLVDFQGPSVVVNSDKRYQFDGTLGPTCTQGQVFNLVAKQCVDHCLKGYRSALMAYGQTGTGKSHTMCCTKPGEEGVIPRAAQTLFAEMERQGDSREFAMHVQFLQIYRDHLGDLMTESGREKVDIYFDKDGVTMPGCSVHEIRSVDEFMSIYREGDKRRVTTATAMNPESSRGHTALVVWVTSVAKDDIAAAERKGKITFIDLAGYERFSKTGISNDNTVMKDEAKTINASLLALGHVVTSLSHGDKHIPWRNSKLTRLLQDSIGGNSRTTIILTVGPSPEHLFETTNTLQFGQRAMSVKVQARTTETVNYQHLAAKLQSMLSEKEERINALELQAASVEVMKEEIQSRHTRDVEQLMSSHDDELDRLKSEGASDQRILQVVRQQEIERNNLIEQQKEEITYTAERTEEDTKAITQKISMDHERQLAIMEIRICELEEEVEAKNAIISNLQMDRPAKQSRGPSPDFDAGGAEGDAGADSIRLDGSDDHSPAPPKERSNSFSDLFGGGGIDPTLEAQLVEAVEEYEEKLEKERTRSLNLQMDLDRTKKLCKERAEDLADLERYLGEMREELATSEVVDEQILVTAEFADKLINGAPRVSSVNLIDEQLLLQEQKRFQNELCERDEVIDQLKQAMRMLDTAGEIDMARTTAAFGMAGMTMTARGSRTVNGRPSIAGLAIPMTARGAPPMTSRGGGGGGEQGRMQLDMLRSELEDTRSDCMSLRDRLETVTREKEAIASAKAHSVGADQEEMEEMINVLRSEVNRAEKNLSEEEDSKVHILKERDSLRSLVSQLEDEVIELKQHANSAATEKESESTSMSQQKQLLQTMLGGNRNVMLTECADGLRETVHVLEERLKKKVDELNETRLALQITKNQLRGMNIEIEADRILFKTVEREDGKKPLLSQVEAILDNSDLNIISTCKEAELRIVHSKLEQRERSFLATAHELLKLSEYIANIKTIVREKAPDVALPPIDLRSLHDICASPESILTGNELSQRDTQSLERQRRESLEVYPMDPTRAQLESVLQLMKALRKQNAMLHTVVMERSALLKHYAWLVVDSRILPRGTDLKGIVGDVATELRLAFAERDEEIFMKDQAVMQRSLQLVVVEEALATLHAQLTAADMTPSRPATKFALSAAETRQQTEDEIEQRLEVRDRLCDKHTAVSEEISAVTKELAIHEAADEKGELQEAPLDLLRLRSKHEKLVYSMEMLVAQMASQDSELDLLRQSLSQVTRLYSEAQAQKDIDVSLSVVEKFKTRFLRK